MIARNSRFQISVTTLAVASFILAAAVPASQQTTSSPTNVVAQKSKPISTPIIPQTPVASPTPTLRMPKDLALPANANTLRPSDIPEANLGELEKSFDAAAYRRAVKNGEMALKKEDWNNAALELQEALTLNPNSKELTYNLGIAKFRQGDFAEAEKLFKDSAETTSADLAAKSMFNEGNAIYANAVKNLEQSKTQTNPNMPPSAGSPQEPAPDLEKGIEKVQKAFTHFKDALAATPQDDDSAVNAETALKLLKIMKEEQKKQ
ncbi:MAG: tetratricopeptide repeat protein, partial [Phycisphaerae bacterium]